MGTKKRKEYEKILPITQKDREEKLLSFKKPGTTPKTVNSRTIGSSGIGTSKKIKLSGPIPLLSIGAPPKYNNLA